MNGGSGMDHTGKVFVAGGTGMVGSAIVRCLEAEGFEQILAPPRAELDLMDQRQVDEWFGEHRPTYVFDAAARVGGILANDSHPADFLHDNLVIQTNVIGAAWRSRVEKLLFLGSTCIYPRLAPQPLKEEYLLTGPLEPTNEWYAVAKIAGIKLCQAYRRQHGCNFISAMPTNLYGPNDNYDLESSHVLPALIRKFDDARERGAPSVVVWGTGTPRREFLHVDDCARACVHLMEQYDGEDIVNVGVGEDLPIGDLARLVARIVGFEGGIEFDTSKPDGTPRKLVDVAHLSALGWRASITLEDGIRDAYSWYRANRAAFT